MPQPGEWGRTLQWTVGFAVAGFIALSIPGRATPKASAAEEQLEQMSSDPAALESYLKGLSGREQQQVSNALAQYRRGAPKPAKAPARRRHGPVDAPVKIVEWTDPMCPHCKMLVEAVAKMKKRVPEGKMSLEARSYPLDGGCNPTISPQHTDGGLRCLAVKATICLESAPDYWELREKLFQAQEALTIDNVMKIASSGTAVTRSQLEACVNSPDTTQKLQEDIAYAVQHDIHGTPLVVVNGREVMPSVPFLYALAMAGGDANAPAFRVLPPANLPMADSHAH
jgi:serine/threonine-protein kinase